MKATATTTWREKNPDAAVGFLGLSFARPPRVSPELDRIKAELEQRLRGAYTDRNQIKTDPTVAAYTAYYKQFKSTYHVLLQLDSIVLKGKSLPPAFPLVGAMFTAELKTAILTSGHDLDAIQGDLTMDVAKGEESFISLAGKERQVKAGDTILSDRSGCIGSIIYGPDQRTKLTPKTSRALFVAWGVPGMNQDLISNHLSELELLARAIDPEVEILFRRMD